MPRLFEDDDNSSLRFVKTLVFVKNADGDFEVLRVWTDKNNGASGNESRLSIDKFKADYPKCFQ